MKYGWFLIMCLFAGQAGAAERVVLVLGDSLSAAFGIPAESGWVTLLQQRLDGRQMPWRVVNAGISGDTTAGGVSRLPRLLELHQPRVVVIELGSNDGLRGFGFDQITGNLERMIAMSREAGAAPLLVGGMLPPNYGSAYAQAFHGLFKDVAERAGVPLVPFLMEGVARNPELMQADGYHPNSDGQPPMLDNVWEVLQPLLGSLEPAPVK